MKKLVIIPGGFHPFHAGHKALYDAAVAAFPSADVYVAATKDTSNRPFEFPIKEKLAQLAGIPEHRFIQVKSPFRAEEITQHFDPNDTQLIFVRSEKDRNETPQAGGVKKDGSSSYLQPYKRNGLQPMSQHGYMAYLPVVQFGPGMTSATEIRAKWPLMTPDQKAELVHALYPQTEDNDKLTTVTAKLLDAGMKVTKPAPAKKAAPEAPVDEATLVNDPERGVEIRPTGGLGSYSEDTLKASLVKQLMDIAGMLKSGNYRGVEHLLYKGGAVQSKIQALARLEDFNAKQGRRPIARGREIDIGESDYIDEN
jgi:hypothetical protein